MFSTHTRKRKRRFLEVMYRFSTLIVVMVSWLYTYDQTHLDVYKLNVYQFCACQWYLNKAEKTRKFSTKKKTPNKSKYALQGSPLNGQLVLDSPRPFEEPYEKWARILYSLGKWGNHVSIYSLDSASPSSCLVSGRHLSFEQKKKYKEARI